jgi:hypothetical protein
MIASLIASLIAALYLIGDCNHCRVWTTTPHGIRCADIRLGARCLHSGWHEFMGAAVCVRDCGPEGKPTT